MALTAPELVAAAMKALDVDNPTDLAKAMGLGPWSPQKVKRWLRGENEPSYEATIALLEQAGWLRKSGAAAAVRDPAAPADPLARIAVAVAELAKTQALIADHLGVPRADVELPEAPPSPLTEAPTGNSQ
jgi:hypothetical protein